eukprot:gene4368-14491_t
MKMVFRLASVTTPTRPSLLHGIGRARSASIQAPPFSPFLPTSLRHLSQVASATATKTFVDPTFVPRNPRVTDGVWNQVDIEQVALAQRDANQIIKSEKIEKGDELVLLGRSLEDLEELAVQYGQPKYRGKQLLDALMQGARSMEEIKTIPKAWRESMVADGVRTGRAIIHLTVPSPDGTMKFLLQAADGRLIECVGIPADGSEPKPETKVERAKRYGDPAPGKRTTKNYVRGGGQAIPVQDNGAGEEGGGKKRLTVCVSSQVGCPMRCRFCATGKGGFARNLKAYEILDQVMTVQEIFGERVSNVVFMGMGEPLLNLPSVVKACKLLKEQIGLGARYITISTVGVPNAIFKLAHADIKATLAVSIHAPDQKLRESLIPSAKAYPIEALMRDCVKFYELTGRRVTYEYTLMNEVNDSVKHKYKLMTHVNVIPWNPVDDSEYSRPSGNRIHAFKQALESAGIPATIRVTRGVEAGAACGQLRNQHQKEPLKEFSIPT